VIRPPVVLLHGLASSFEHNWREPGWVDLLTEAGRDVLEVDLPGHGRGPHATVPAAYADVPGAVLSRIADQAPDATQIDAVGFSRGGHTLLSIAVTRPEFFRRLALLGVGDSVFAAPARTSNALADVFTATTEPETDPARIFWRLARAAGNDPAALSAFVRRDVPAGLDPVDVARVSCPVLVIIGDRDFAGPADALVAALPQARLEVLRGTDHFGTTSDYRCIGAVLEFLDG
jgi:pimeloyl-ACP methyl ester carboxylesterase